MAESEEVDTVFFGQGLQLTVVVARACVALPVVLRQKKVNHVTPSPADFGRVSFYGNGLGDREGTGGLKSAHALDLDQTDPTHTRDTQVIVVTKRGNVNPEFHGSFENRCAGWNLQLLIIYGDGDRRSDALALELIDVSATLAQRRARVSI